MKLNKIFSVIALGSVFFASCGDDFLTVENPTAQPIEEYFTTAEHLQEALVAAYAPLHWTDWSNGQYNPLPIMSDIMADQIWVGGSKLVELCVENGRLTHVLTDEPVGGPASDVRIQ